MDVYNIGYNIHYTLCETMAVPSPSANVTPNEQIHTQTVTAIFRPLTGSNRLTAAILPMMARLVVEDFEERTVDRRDGFAVDSPLVVVRFRPRVA